IRRSEAANWASVKDRSRADTRVIDQHYEDDPEASSDPPKPPPQRLVHEEAYYQLLAWARAKGHDEVVKEIRQWEKEGTVRFWGAGAFQRWSQELDTDTDAKKPDPRAWTSQVRGKVFVTTGVMAEYAKEDWDTI